MAHDFEAKCCGSQQVRSPLLAHDFEAKCHGSQLVKSPPMSLTPFHLFFTWLHVQFLHSVAVSYYLDGLDSPLLLRHESGAHTNWEHLCILSLQLWSVSPLGSSAVTFLLPNYVSGCMLGSCCRCGAWLPDSASSFTLFHSTHGFCWRGRRLPCR